LAIHLFLECGLFIFLHRGLDEVYSHRLETVNSILEFLEAPGVDVLALLNSISFAHFVPFGLMVSRKRSNWVGENP
jgi:hypothetical protein